MGMLNRSAVVVKPKQPFLDWLHAADPTGCPNTLQEQVHEPSIYPIPGCDTKKEVADLLRDLCQEIFAGQVDYWYRDRTTWPNDRSFDVSCRWLDHHLHSVLIDLCHEPLVEELD